MVQNRDRARRWIRLRGRSAALVLAALMISGCGGRPSGPPAVATNSPATPGAVQSPIPTAAATSAAADASPGRSEPVGTASAAAESPSAVPVRSQCQKLTASLSRREQVGQLLMVAVPSTGVGSGPAATIRRQRVGSVILLGNTSAGVAGVRRVTKQATAAAREPRKVKLLLAADQEGGLVQRLQGPGFDRIPSAEQQARESPAALRKDAQRWGTQLRRAGINANLAPVADVVPKDLRRVNQPIGVLRRGYGSDPTVVSTHVAAFVSGMDAAAVATAVKHFPGLGAVRGNTDFVSRVVDTRTKRRSAALFPFAAGVDAGTDMVMVSSAYYAKIDPARRAAYSPVVIKQLLRGDLGFTGVVISDDLAAAAMRDLTPGQRILRFLRAGGDLAIVGDPALAQPMAAAVLAASRTDPKLAAQVEAAASRIVQLKANRGLAAC